MEYDMSGSSTDKDFEVLGELSQKLLDKNSTHQGALTQYADTLEDEKKELEELVRILSLQADDEESFQPEVVIPGSRRPWGLINWHEFQNPESPFYEESQQRAQYLRDTTDHPMKAKDLDNLADAVRGENRRLKALKSQETGIPDTTIDIERNTEGVDWEVVCDKITSDSRSEFKRTPEQYRIKWMGDRHPDINHTDWETSEIDSLNRIVLQYSKAKKKIDWVAIAESLGTNRTPLDCMRNSSMRVRQIVWTPDLDNKLINAVEKYGTNNWSVVTRAVSEEAHAGQCSNRYHRALDPKVKRGPWDQAEFGRLKEATEAWDNSWVEVATCMRGRTNDFCREKWAEHVSTSSAQAEWSEEDDKNLLKYVEEMGNQWKLIAKKIGNGASGTKCKNRHEKLKRLQELYKKAIPVPAPKSSTTTGPATSTLKFVHHKPGSEPEPSPPTIPIIQTTDLSTHRFEISTPSGPLAPPAWTPYPETTFHTRWHTPSTQADVPPQSTPVHQGVFHVSGQQSVPRLVQHRGTALLLPGNDQSEELNSRAPDSNDSASGSRNEGQPGGLTKKTPIPAPKRKRGFTSIEVPQANAAQNGESTSSSDAPPKAKTARPRPKPRPIAKPKGLLAQPTGAAAEPDSMQIDETRDSQEEAAEKVPPKRKRGRPRKSDLDIPATPAKKAKVTEPPATVRRSPRKVGQLSEARQGQEATNQTKEAEGDRSELRESPRRSGGRTRGKGK